MLYNQTFSIPYEGVFSTYFLFGKHKPVIDDGGSLDDLFADIFDFEDDETPPDAHKRSLTPAHAIEMTQPHLLVKGQISFVNSFGFLNADQYPLMRFYLVMFFVYLVATSYWLR
mgnify:CR=1 FL=1